MSRSNENTTCWAGLFRALGNLFKSNVAVLENAGEHALKDIITDGINSKLNFLTQEQRDQITKNTTQCVSDVGANTMNGVNAWIDTVSTVASDVHSEPVVSISLAGACVSSN
jgi:hypothetical protein